MNQPISSDFKIGILGGGQLGKMFCQQSSSWDINTYILESSADCPASTVCTKLIVGDITNFEDVYNFGKLVDVITVEIERVNVDALKKLEQEGKTVLPDTFALATIQDKGLQKEFYQKNSITTSAFGLYENIEEIKSSILNGTIKFPFVQKLRTGGYDGRGVAIINNNKDLNLLIEGKSVIEDLVEIDKEIAVIVARNIHGETKCFPPVEMEFNPKANLVEFLFSPANISEAHIKEAEALSTKIVDCFNFVGLLVVELFIDKNGDIYVNEVAPRPHNSGHHTIEGNVTSQYEQHLRAIIGYPLGSTTSKLSAVMINLLGKENYEGAVKYEGIGDCMKIEGAKFHIYGKKITKPFRKMGHITIIDKNLEEAKRKAKYIKNHLKVIA